MTPRRLGYSTAAAIASLLVVSAALVMCSSHKTDGTAVTVVSDPSGVRDCVFLGRVTGPSGEEGALSTSKMRQLVLDMGGNTLLLRPAGSGEALDCAGELRVQAPPTLRSPTALFGRLPTPIATPRT
jgi:hypothetical protein